MGFLCQGARPAAGWAQGLIRSRKRAKKKPPAGTGGFYVIVNENLRLRCALVKRQLSHSPLLRC